MIDLASGLQLFLPLSSAGGRNGVPAKFAQESVLTTSQHRHTIIHSNPDDRLTSCGHASLAVKQLHNLEEYLSSRLPRWKCGFWSRAVVLSSVNLIDLTWPVESQRIDEVRWRICEWEQLPLQARVSRATYN
ncbi:hypothetical protein PCASD_08358 [Puccinia coronata f. sp. avenae]|uniref:Uncharacterized protein n=1 Tax=Puccinia coronata f. sp. avenae TaxID=200324 RepID=A0A2N5USN6_9BASI|nr:hypothetical protein PCASD_08358 [Puccinia coronata f. sp. avenae]